jgi:hypothetical protein
MRWHHHTYLQDPLKPVQLQPWLCSDPEWVEGCKGGDEGGGASSTESDEEEGTPSKESDGGREEDVEGSPMDLRAGVLWTEEGGELYGENVSSNSSKENPSPSSRLCDLVEEEGGTGMSISGTSIPSDFKMFLTFTTCSMADCHLERISAISSCKVSTTSASSSIRERASLSSFSIACKADRAIFNALRQR